MIRKDRKEEDVLMKKRISILLVFVLTAASLSGCGSKTADKTGGEETAQTTVADDSPYKLIMVEEPKASGGGAVTQTANASTASTDDPYKNNDPYKGGGDTSDPYKNNDPYKNAGGGATSDPYKNAGGAAANDPYKNAGGGAVQEQPEVQEPQEPEGPYVPEPSEGAKYTVAVTDDGWVKVENEGGEILGLSSTSGVKIIEEDGLAFKDLNQNGQLDIYEDWRKTSEERAADLVAQMQGAERAVILAHGGWDGDFVTEPLTEDHPTVAYLRNGGRGGVTRAISNGGGNHAKWTNAIQEVAESCYYGIPAMISIDPCNISGMVESLSLSSSMNPELAAKIGQETAKQYRAAGVTALLGPQVDIASPVMSRAGGTYGEDPQLTLDITTAYVNGMQSTYDENGEDLGWGDESVYCFTKHFGGAGSTEGGRDDHTYAGRYAIFPGSNLEAHMITYFDGVFNLPGKTGSSGIMTEYAINVDKDGEPFGGEYAGAYNPFLYHLLDEAGFDSLKITDWGVFGGLGLKTGGLWGTEELSEPERIKLGFERGVNLLGGYGNLENITEGYNLLAADLGQETADAILSKAAYNYIELMMDLNMFDQPYNDSAYADSIIFSESANEYGKETQEQSVVMIKNDGTVKEGSDKEKPKVYVPYVYSTGFSANWMFGINPGTPSWQPGMDLDTLGQYFEIVTDTLGDPTGESGMDGNPTYTKEDLTRASKEDIAGCDYILVGMNAAYSASYSSYLTAAFGPPTEPEGEEVYYPPSLQYAEYTADKAADPSLSGCLVEGKKENRSYKGVTAPADANYGHLEALQYAKENAGDVPVIASVAMERGMVWTEAEPLCNVILVSYNGQKTDAVAKIILGQLEPQGLLVFQQPASMEAVEAQLSDVPRDMECYKDADGNVYDFAFGMNWSGVISDERTEKYSAEPLTKVTSVDFGDIFQAAGDPEQYIKIPGAPYIPEPSEDAKYSVTVTDDGWIKIENEDGETLGLSSRSGVEIIEDEGLAFKDLNQNGKIDVYEDWRKDPEERAKDLVDQMQGAERAMILAHGGWDGPFTTEPLAADDASLTYLQAGGRGGVTRAISNGGGAHAKWTNSIQEGAESCYYGIPAMISIDPANISGLIETLSLASTMDPELAAEIGRETSKQYRATGVTALLGPQVDIASPIMSRAGGTYGEDPQLTLDIATAYVNGMQSTYSEDGEDLGWGSESVYCFTKHFGGAGSTEGGRDDHTYAGRYAVFPGSNLEAHLITYFDGVFRLPGKTGSSGIMTQYAIDVDKDGEPFGGEWAGAYSPFLYGLLEEYGYDSLKITDWGVFGDLGEKIGGIWGTEGMSQPERLSLGFQRGVNLLGGYGGYGGIMNVAEGYNALVEECGQDKADEIVSDAAYKYIVLMMKLKMFEQPYNDSAYADSIIFSDSAMEYGKETQDQSVVMIKNDGTIKKDGSGKDKPKVYVPYVYSTGFAANWMMGINPGTPSWQPGMNLDTLSVYFDVVTDTLAEASGEPGMDGNPVYTKDDITRASEEDIKDCDYILVGMNGAYSASYSSYLQPAFGPPTEVEGDEVYYPASLQYAAYTADTARDPSISGNLVEGEKENRSYKGVTAPDDANYGHLEALEYAASIAGDIPVIASVCMERGMVWTETEPLCDVILVSYNAQKTDSVAKIVLGQLEPQGLLVFQQPASMEAVEKQLDDVPRDMECYKDAAENTYDFAFGMNWNGVIEDERTEKYSKEPLTKITSFDFGSRFLSASDETTEAETGEKEKGE